MPEQFSLPGFAPGLQPTDSLFFAIFPDPDTAQQITQLASQLRAEHRLKGKPLDTTRLHVTLHHLGNYAGLPQEIVTRAGAAAASIAMPHFDVAFDRAMSFASKPRNRPFVLAGGEGVAALTRFQQALGVALEEAGLGAGRRATYTPHVTLLYGNDFVVARPVHAIGWTVREFVLVHSLLGRTRYIPLGRWPFLP